MFKSTTVKGNFHNSDDTTNSINANSIIDRNLTVGENILTSSLTFNNSMSVKQIMLFNGDLTNSFNNHCISIEPNTIRYNINSLVYDCHLFSSANDNATPTGYFNLLKLSFNH
jgi:hypothetical protein